MRVYLTNNSNVALGLSNAFDEVPLFLAELEDSDDLVKQESIINKYSRYRKWSLKLQTSKRTIFTSIDVLHNEYYLVIKE